MAGMQVPQPEDGPRGQQALGMAVREFGSPVIFSFILPIEGSNTGRSRH